MKPFLLLLLWSCCLPSWLTAAEKPNILLFVADDLGYGELGCQGNSEIPTPHIDSIANGGVRFTNGYVTAAYCSASRAGLMTGRYQTRFGYEFNPVGHFNEDPTFGLPMEETTLPEYLLEAGYVSALIGKWHLGGTAKFHPFRHGFDEFYGFLHEGHYFVPPPYDGVTTMLRRSVLPGGGEGRWTSKDGKTIYTTHMGHTEPDYDANNPIYRGGQPFEETQNLTDAITREASNFIERNQDRPFFLYVPFNAVHSPLQGADEYMEKFADIKDVQRRIFAAMLAQMDDAVGSVLDTLSKAGLEENTLVIFLSDNGGPTRELTSSNGPLRSEKGNVYEGGIRVPFMMQWKGTLPVGEVYSQPVISLDIYATAAAIAGKPVPQGKIDGVNLMPVLLGETDDRPHETLFWRMGRRTALRSGDWKLVKNPGRGNPGDWELYDLQNDIGEADDRAKENPEKLQQLLDQWETLNAEMKEPIWSPR